MGINQSWFILTESLLLVAVVRPVLLEDEILCRVIGLESLVRLVLHGQPHGEPLALQSRENDEFEPKKDEKIMGSDWLLEVCLVYEEESQTRQ